jgi:ABC-type nitrate/sulfonate/bicarbonate transport system ATPase subunit
MAGIRVTGVIKSYTSPDGGERPALGKIDLEIDDGEFVCLLGPSGCGKTTLLNILSGLDRDHQGSVEFTGGGVAARRNGAAADRRDGAAGARAGRGTVEDGQRRGAEPVFSYMFQESRLLPWLTVRDNLRFVLDEGGGRRREGALIDGWLERVGLAGSGGYFPSQLSVGMQQRVALVRALIVRPEVLFMDEPLSSLDELTASRMRDELLALWTEQLPTVVFVTHNPLEAVYLADRVLIMSAGPGRIIHELDVLEELPRPRDPEDTRLWALSRECVRNLKGEEREGATLLV